MNRRDFISQTATAVALAAATGSARAAYPDRPIRMVVPFPAGGAVDVMGRLIADNMRTLLGQNIVVDNKAGAGGMIGSAEVSRAPADGYTLLFNSSSLVQAPLVSQQNLYDPIKGFTPIGGLGTTAMPLVISTSVPATTLTEFVAWCKGKSLSYGSYSPGTTSHAFQQLFSDVNKLNMVHVPYRGEGPMVIDLLGDRVQCAMGTMSTLSPHIRSGRIRALASLSDTRIPSLPGVPTFLELGYPKAFGWTGFIGLFAPAELPKPVAEKLAGAFARVLAMPAVREKLVSMDVVIQESLLGATGVQVAKTYSAWARLVVDLNLAASA